MNATATPLAAFTTPATPATLAERRAHLRLVTNDQMAVVPTASPMPAALSLAGGTYTGADTGYVEVQPITANAWRHWDTLVALSASPATPNLRARMATALAALVAELTPTSREVLASTYTSRGAVGATRLWDLPPYLTGGLREQQRWAALVLLDCVEEQANRACGIHSLAERTAWRTAARTITQGYQTAPGTGRRIATA